MDQNLFKKLTTDRTFRTEFMASPTQMLISAGFADFEGKSVIVHENSATTMHFSLLPKGSDASSIENMDTKFVKIQEKVWADLEFKANLLEDTRNTLMEFFGSIPESLTIKIHENTKDAIHLVLPAFPSDTDELNDDDLEMIAGGKGTPVQVVDTVLEVAKNVYDVIPDPLLKGANEIGGRTRQLGKDLVNAGQNFFSGW
ncbi:MAG: hypothetical protein CVV64_12900 [Candidatus Wallbacteria bacterium HGW-Wallbacteria-1]|jgi:hypothetical protein|uniref:Nitrile hydratase alpha/Thiocyanate hydrolase gamma domain-containing protein n=1 Tax=Candidatus Wallbacteria bacterium HGW-Wallbacteria-1 TaxID=2013854 RepID=A0A2N1PN08_9BACT|nr:MAG: hypothetical protein CVV64_12900 [Candidatus Wallbacteria bacterium HGW-Wallbacteria-1]